MYTGKGPRYEKRKEAVDEDAAGKKNVPKCRYAEVAP